RHSHRLALKCIGPERTNFREGRFHIATRSLTGSSYDVHVLASYSDIVAVTVTTHHRRNRRIRSIRDNDRHRNQMHAHSQEDIAPYPEGLWSRQSLTVDAPSSSRMGMP